MPIHVAVGGMGAVAPELTLRRRVSSREFACLTAAVLAVAAGIGVALAYVGALSAATTEFSDVAPFHGWQVLATEIAAGVVSAAVLVGSLWWFRRLYRSLRDRTRHRRVVVIAAVLPGLALGALLGAHAFRPLFGWASDHTARAGELRDELAAARHDLRHAPGPVRVFEPPAPTDMADRMLRPVDLGAAWYPVMRPAGPVSMRLPSDVAASGGVSRARAWLTRAHRVGQAWDIDQSVLEAETRFGSPTQVRDYLRAIATAPDSTCGCGAGPGSVVRTRMRGVRVSYAANDSHLWSAFVVGDRLFTVSSVSDRLRPPSHADLMRPLRVAVARALHSS